MREIYTNRLGFHSPSCVRRKWLIWIFKWLRIMLTLNLSRKLLLCERKERFTTLTQQLPQMFSHFHYHRGFCDKIHDNFNLIAVKCGARHMPHTCRILHSAAAVWVAGRKDLQPKRHSLFIPASLSVNIRIRCGLSANALHSLSVISFY